MAVSYSHGAIQWLAADAANTTYAVSSLGFVPKALRFTTSGISSATDAGSSATHIRKCVGFATSPSDRRCVSAQDLDASADMVCTSGVRDDAVVGTVTSTGPAFDGLLDLASIDADGFTLIVDDASPVNITVFWEAWGGTDIEVASTFELAEPAATGSVTYPLTGLVSTDTGHQVLMFAGVQSTGATPSVTRSGSDVCIGYATGASTKQVVVVGGNVDAGASSESHRYNQTGECLAMFRNATGSDDPEARAALTAFTDNGFTLNWIARAVTGRKYIGLAIKGGSWTAGSGTVARGTLNDTMTVSGLAYAPVGVDVLHTAMTVLAAGTGGVGDYISQGMGTSTTSRRTISWYSEDSLVASSAEVSVQYDQIATLFFSASVDFTMDISAMNSDGFQLIVDDASAFAATIWIGYLTFGAGLAAPPASTGGGFKSRYRRFHHGG